MPWKWIVAGLLFGVVLDFVAPYWGIPLITAVGGWWIVRASLPVASGGLWGIAEAAYGKGWLHERIQAANADQLGTGAQLKPGMVLRLPSAE